MALSLAERRRVLLSGKIVDYGIARVLQAGVAAEFSAGQLWNPAGSGKMLELIEVLASQEIGGPLAWGITATEIGGAAQLLVANDGSAYAGVAECTSDTDPTVTTYLAAAEAFNMVAGGGGQLSPLWTPGTMLFVHPGFGLTLVEQTAQRQLAFAVLFLEHASG